MSDHGCRVPSGVHHLDRVDRLAGIGPGDCLAPEDVDHPGQGGHGRVPHGDGQGCNGPERTPVRCGQHGRVGIDAVVAANQVCDAGDGDGGSVRSRRGKGADDTGDPAGRRTRGRRRSLRYRLDRSDSGGRAAAEHHVAAAQRGPSGVVNGRTQGRSWSERPCGGIEGVDATRGRAALGEATEDRDVCAAAIQHDSAAERGCQAPGEKAGLYGRWCCGRPAVRPRSVGVWVAVRCRRQPELDGSRASCQDDGHDQEGAMPPSALSGHGRGVAQASRADMVKKSRDHQLSK